MFDNEQSSNLTEKIDTSSAGVLTPGEEVTASKLAAYHTSQLKELQRQGETMFEMNTNKQQFGGDCMHVIAKRLVRKHMPQNSFLTWRRNSPLAYTGQQLAQSTSDSENLINLSLPRKRCRGI